MIAPLHRFICVVWECLGLVWRVHPSGHGRVSLRTAWRVARLYHTDLVQRKDTR